MKAVMLDRSHEGIILIGGALVCMFIFAFLICGGPVATFSSPWRW